jgi:hypothetical protein
VISISGGESANRLGDDTSATEDPEDGKGGETVTDSEKSMGSREPD